MNMQPPKKKNILVVDDEAELVSILIDDLGDIAPIAFHSARDGSLAYKKSRSREFDLIFTDFRMPRLSGVDLISALREQDFNNNVPVIIISGYEEEAKAACAKHNLSSNIEILSKPYDVETVRRLAKHYLDGAKSESTEKPTVSAPAARPKVDVEFLNTFWNAATDAVATMGQVLDIKAARTFRLNLNQIQGIDLSAAVSIDAPQFSGTLFLSFPKATFLTVVSKMLSQEYKELAPENTLGAVELANIVYGQAKRSFEDKNYQMEKSNTKLLQGADDHAAVSSAPVLATEFTSSAGTFFVAISINLKDQARAA
jgi:CheY-like chemotaxis protein/CheY-specific phosphatase CheX